MAQVVFIQLKNRYKQCNNELIWLIKVASQKASHKGQNHGIICDGLTKLMVKINVRKLEMGLGSLYNHLGQS